MINRWFRFPKKNQLLIGPRRSGKTTFLRSSFPHHRYVTLDDFDYLSLARRDPKGFVRELGAKAIVDEIQRVPEVTIAIKMAIDENALEVLMTGSSGLGLLSVAADTLAGRIGIMHFPTTCFGEEVGSPTHSIFDEEAPALVLAEGRRALENALIYGGFPEVVVAPDNAARDEILHLYRDSYFTRDLAQLSNIENVEGLLAVLNHFARSIGSHIDVVNFAQESGLSQPTTKKYLNALAQAELSLRLYGRQFGPAKRYVKAAKGYFSDIGLLHALRQQVNRGQRVENFVISELEKRRKVFAPLSEAPFYYKSTSGAEIDLIIELPNETLLVEIKSGAVPRRSDIRHLLDYHKNAVHKKNRAFLFHCGDEYSELDGVRCIPIAALYRARW